MKDLNLFVTEYMWFIIFFLSVTCLILGRIWSNNLNWGEITDPEVIMKNGKNYKIINMYTGENWTDNWNVGSIVCFKSYYSRFTKKYERDIYVSGDKIRFDGDPPGIGSVYKAIFPRTQNGLILMKPVIIKT